MSLEAEMRAALQSRAGRSAAGLSGILDDWKSVESLPSVLLALAAEAEVQIGATWLIKRGIETGAVQADAVGNALLADLRRYREPEAILHVLQILPYLRIPAARVGATAEFLRACLEADNKFVCAWGYSGFHTLAVQFPEYRDEVAGLMERGLQTGSAATRARIRNLQRQGFGENR